MFATLDRMRSVWYVNGPWISKVIFKSSPFLLILRISDMSVFPYILPICQTCFICKFSVMSAYKIAYIECSLYIYIAIQQCLLKIYWVYNKIIVFDQDSSQLLLRAENANAFYYISVEDFCVHIDTIYFLNLLT